MKLTWSCVAESTSLAYHARSGGWHLDVCWQAPHDVTWAVSGHSNGEDVIVAHGDIPVPETENGLHEAVEAAKSAAIGATPLRRPKAHR